MNVILIKIQIKIAEILLSRKLKIENMNQRYFFKFCIAMTLGTTTFMGATLSNAASFDCTKSQTYIEKTICNDSSLNEYDEIVGKRFNIIKNQLDAQSKATFIQMQKEWIISRNQCTSVDCIANSYKNIFEKYCPIENSLNISCINSKPQQTASAVKEEMLSATAASTATTTLPNTSIYGQWTEDNVGGMAYEIIHGLPKEYEVKRAIKDVQSKGVRIMALQQVGTNQFDGVDIYANGKLLPIIGELTDNGILLIYDKRNGKKNGSPIRLKNHKPQSYIVKELVANSKSTPMLTNINKEIDAFVDGLTTFIANNFTNQNNNFEKTKVVVIDVISAIIISLTILALLIT